MKEGRQWFTRIAVARSWSKRWRELKLEYPTVTQDKRTELQTIRQLLMSEED